MARWNDQSTLRHQIKFIEILWIFQVFFFFFPPPQKIGFSMFFLLTIFHGYFLLGKWPSISTQRRRDVNLLRTRAWRSSPRERRENRGRMDVCMGKHKKTTFKWMGRYIYIYMCVYVLRHIVSTSNGNIMRSYWYYAARTLRESQCWPTNMRSLIHSRHQDKPGWYCLSRFGP